ncbi:hypothetical protein GURKE_00300 [Brevundimonas phage vB_BpoS-Gurke]|uniref:Uncharacterized protein n=1 Tax=Brevundimonas phage vB_BpoS-Gurke TaxID=2948599 RepID=A0A9E7N3X1_9CAUD|nr:hypothetical protein GURKE_00300 [Brevundimonas phage vB_BpoS-Gurke]
MKMNRRTLIASALAISAVGAAPAVGMDLESAVMEDGSMWRAVAMNGTPLIYDDSRPRSAVKLALTMSSLINATPARADDPQLRNLLDAAVADGRLTVAETDLAGIPIAWVVTMKGRFYACEHTFDEPDDVYTFRQAVATYGMGETRFDPHQRWVRLLRQTHPLDNLAVDERYLVEEFAGLLQQGVVYPVAATWRPNRQSRFYFRKTAGQDEHLETLSYSRKDRESFWKI